MEQIKILAISGSLRRGSSNAALLQAAARVAPYGMRIDLYGGMESLPHFNPDLDGIGAIAPDAVAEFRSLLREADAVIVSSPEYAHGVPGSLKNALDWIVSSGEFSRKPVVLLNASSGGGEFAQTSLQETLSVMEAEIVKEASLVAPFVRSRMSADGTLADPEVDALLAKSMSVLAEAISSRRKNEAFPE